MNVFLKPKLILRGGLLWFLAVFSAAAQESEKIYTAVDFHALERENQMWRLVDAREEVDANIVKLKKAGFPTAEIEGFRSYLEKLWDVDPLRQWGWMDRVAVKQVKAIDREFKVRMREARIRKEIGLKSGAHAPETTYEVNRRWHAAIVQVLEYSDLQEFLLMNSISARTIYRATKDFDLSTVKRRKLCAWQREYDAFEARLRDGIGWTAADGILLNQARLELWQHIGEVVSPDNLKKASPAFLSMTTALHKIGDVSTGMMLELWRVRVNYERAIAAKQTDSDMLKLNAAAREAAGLILGADALSAYLERADASWLIENISHGS